MIGVHHEQEQGEDGGERGARVNVRKCWQMNGRGDESRRICILPDLPFA